MAGPSENNGLILVKREITEGTDPVPVPALNAVPVFGGIAPTVNAQAIARRFLTGDLSRYATRIGRKLSQAAAGPGSHLKWKLIWHVFVRRAVKKALKGNPEMLNKLFEIGKGTWSKVGLIGAFLASIGAVFADAAANPPADLNGWLAVLQQLFVVIGSTGILRKLIAFFEKKVEAKPE